MLEIVTSAFNEMSNRDIMNNAALISSFATKHESKSTSRSIPPSFSTVTGHDGKSSASVRSTFASKEHLKRLEALGMSGMLNNHRFLPEETSVKVIAWLPTVIHGMFV